MAVGWRGAGLAFVLCVAGCGGGDADAWATRGAAVPVPNEPQPTRSPDASVVGVDGLRVALEGRVAATAGLVRPLKSDCDTTVATPSFTCRVTFMDEVVTYRVTTEARGTNSFTWKAQADAMVVTRTGIQAAVWRTYSPRATAIRCDAFPERQRAAPRAVLPGRCYVKPTLSDRAFGRDSGNAARTVAVKISVYDGSLGLTEQTQ
ncbi:hypothetical protein [Actinomadura rugatobispora]|uniref:DUF4333 domain-containing protein n=1 Tax=Actinomadura rugatobispora TaxID=1994 RepID=A0ABW1AAC3_9ACTN|nr:hypothetical protein GCM10010200_025910 [Actinomadura rugatobispora]